MCTYIYKYHTCINAYRYKHYIRSTNSSIAWRRCVYVCVDVCLLCEPDVYTYIDKYHTCIMYIDICIIAVLLIALSHAIRLTKHVLLYACSVRLLQKLCTGNCANTYF